MLKQRRIRENAARTLQVDEAVQLFAFCLSDVRQLPVPSPQAAPAEAAAAAGEPHPPSADQVPASSAAAASASHPGNSAAGPSSQHAAPHSRAPVLEPQELPTSWSGAQLHVDLLNDCIGLPIPTAAGMLTNAGSRG